MDITIGKHKTHPTSFTMRGGKVVNWCMKCACTFGDEVKENKQSDVVTEAAVAEKKETEKKA